MCAYVTWQLSGRQDLGLLSLEFGLGEDALRLELGKVLQLRNGVRCGRRLWWWLLLWWWWCCILRLLRILLIILLRPPILLPP